jgi:hypothetical protein
MRDGFYFAREIPLAIDALGCQQLGNASRISTTPSQLLSPRKGLADSFFECGCNGGARCVYPHPRPSTDSFPQSSTRSGRAGDTGKRSNCNGILRFHQLILPRVTNQSLIVVAGCHERRLRTPLGRRLTSRQFAFTPVALTKAAFMLSSFLIYTSSSAGVRTSGSTPIVLSFSCTLDACIAFNVWP